MLHGASVGATANVNAPVWTSAAAESLAAVVLAHLNSPATGVISHSHQPSNVCPLLGVTVTVRPLTGQGPRNRLSVPR